MGFSFIRVYDHKRTYTHRLYGGARWLSNFVIPAKVKHGVINECARLNTKNGCQ